MLRLAFLALGAVGDGEDFQIALLALGILSVVYLSVFVFLRRRRSKLAAREETNSDTDITSAVSPQGH